MQGAKWWPSTRRFSSEAELIVKVKEPQPEEYSLLRPGQMLFTYLHLAASRSADGSPDEIGRHGAGV